MATLWSLTGDPKENRPAFVAAVVALHGRDEDGGSFTPYQAQRIASALVSLASQIHSLAVASCNYGLNAGQEKRDERLKAKFAEIATLCGFVATTGGDPRGACAFIAKPGESGDDMGGRGWAVYR
jgi:hypothetical protein